MRNIGANVMIATGAIIMLTGLGMCSRADAQTAYRHGYSRPEIELEFRPTIAPGIRQAPIDHYNGPILRHSTRASAGVLRIKGEVPPNGCEATQGGGFRILSGADRDTCIGQP